MTKTDTFQRFWSIFENFYQKKKFFYKNDEPKSPELTKTLKKRPFIKF